MMDDSQTAFATQYPSYGFDLDMMKVCATTYYPQHSLTHQQRSMDTVGGPDAKKARWSPTSFTSNGANGLSATREAFPNYGYGPQANLSQGYNGSPPASFAANALYSTSLNTPTNGNGMSQQMSPNTAIAFAHQQQQHQQQEQQQNGGGYGGFNGYNMLGIGLPAMLGVGGFPYNNQVANFTQVSCYLCYLSLWRRTASTGVAV